VDFERSDDQIALVDGVSRLLAGRFDIETVRALEALGGVERARWRELGDLGVFGLGDDGLGWADAVLVFEQLGRALVPGPLVATALASEVVDGAVAGDRVVGLVERDVEWPLLVEYLDVLDDLLVLDDDGVWRVDPAEVVAHAVPPLDPLVPVARVDVLPPGTRIADAAASAAWRARGAVLTSALQLGVAAGACDLATAYAKERRQFDKPIGQFQAVKHLCADMASRVEVCRAIVYYAGVCLDDPDVGDVDRAVAAARILAVTASGDNARDCVQVHGGMGYTWEVDAHLFAKRAYVLATSFGAIAEHEEALADLV
jgi:alkylation response protein AidB-like acyl-CoA dehydrogenase